MQQKTIAKGLSGKLPDETEVTLLALCKNCSGIALGGICREKTKEENINDFNKRVKEYDLAIIETTFGEYTQGCKSGLYEDCKCEKRIKYPWEKENNIFESIKKMKND